jgi:hypothetical protein
MTKLFLCTALLFLFACEGDIDLSFKWNGMTPYNASNTTEFPEIFEGDSIEANLYCIQLDMHAEETYREGRYLDTERPPSNGTELEELIITSDVDFNDTLAAGTNLTSAFRILNGSYFFTLPADGSEGYDISNIYSHTFRESPVVEVINLLLIHPPTLGQTYTFEVTCTLEGDYVYSGTTNPIKLY